MNNQGSPMQSNSEQPMAVTQGDKGDKKEGQGGGKGKGKWKEE